jgi:hypothetical protein
MAGKYFLWGLLASTAGAVTGETTLWFASGHAGAIPNSELRGVISNTACRLDFMAIFRKTTARRWTQTHHDQITKISAIRSMRGPGIRRTVVTTDQRRRDPAAAGIRAHVRWACGVLS